MLCLTAFILCVRTVAQSLPVDTPAHHTVPVQKASLSQKLRDDPALQEKITFEATDLPLGELLSSLSRRLTVDLRTTHPLDDQRISLRIHALPVYQLMARLPELLSHTPFAPHGYYWERLAPISGTRPGYRLWRDSRSLLEEREALDFPRTKAALLLRELRKAARMTPEQLAAYKTDLPGDYTTDPDFQPFRDALKGLSDPQMDALARGNAVPIDPTLFPDQVAAFNKQ
jgi:hypothetical protein